MNQEKRMTATWQRWTIDEIDLGVVRLAVAEAQQPLESGVAEAEDHGTPGRVRARVFDVEEVPPDDLWGDEQVEYMKEDQLRPLLKRRSRIRGLPKNRPLREGDVFWIVLPARAEDEEVHTVTVRQVALDKSLDVQVWDVTAAARQVAKRTYDDAVRAASDEEVGQGQPERG